MVVTAEIHNWDHYSLPTGKTYITGEIHGDIRGRWRDGHPIRTSSVVAADGELVTTKSGSVYRLVNQHPKSLPLNLAPPEAA